MANYDFLFEVIDRDGTRSARKARQEELLSLWPEHHTSRGTQSLRASSFLLNKHLRKTVFGEERTSLPQLPYESPKLYSARARPARALRDDDIAGIGSLYDNETEFQDALLDISATGRTKSSLSQYDEHMHGARQADLVGNGLEELYNGGDNPLCE